MTRIQTLLASLALIVAATVTAPAFAGGCHSGNCYQPQGYVSNAQLFQAYQIFCRNPQLCAKYPELTTIVQQKFGAIPGAPAVAPATPGFPQAPIGPAGSQPAIAPPLAGNVAPPVNGTVAAPAPAPAANLAAAPAGPAPSPAPIATPVTVAAPAPVAPPVVKPAPEAPPANGLPEALNPQAQKQSADDQSTADQSAADAGEAATSAETFPEDLPSSEPAV